SKPIVREVTQEEPEAVLGERVVLAQDVAVGEIVGVLGAVGGRQRRDLRAAAGIALRGLRFRGFGPSGESRQIKRRTGGATTGSADVLGIWCLRQRRTGRGRSERTRRARRSWIDRGIERIAAASARGWGWRVGLVRLRLQIGCLRLRGSWWASRRHRAPRAVLDTIVGVRLHAPEQAFELLVAVLQLLDRTCELTNLRFQAVETHVEV